MEWYYVLAILVGTLLFFMLLGLPVVFAFFAANIIGAMLFMGGEKGVAQLIRNAVVATQNFSLLPIPLFILMGEIMFHTGVAARAIDAVDKLIARVPRETIFSRHRRRYTVFVALRIHDRQHSYVGKHTFTGDVQAWLQTGDSDWSNCSGRRNSNADTTIGASRASWKRCTHSD